MQERKCLKQNYYRKNHLAFLLMVFSLLFVVFVDLNVSWSIRFFLIFAALVADYFICARGHYLMSFSRLKCAYLMFGAVVILFFLVFDSRKDVEMISYMAVLLLCILTVFFARTDEAGVRSLIKLYLAAGVLLALYILFVKAFPNIYVQRILPALPEDTRTYALKLHNTGYGAVVGGSIVYADYVMILGFLALLVAFLFRKDSRLLRTRGRRIAAILLMLLFLAAIFFEGRRGELLCLVGASAVVFLLSIRKHHIHEKRKKRRLFIFAGLAVLLILVGLILIGGNARYMITLQRMLNNLSSTDTQDITSGRINYWKRAIELFRTSPVFGIGWGRYANYFRPGQYASDVVSVRINYKYVHNDILNILCEMGVVGLVLTTAPLFYIFVRTFRQNRRLMRMRDEIPGSVLRMNLLSLGIQVFWFLLGLIDPVFYKQFYLCYYAFAVVVQDSALRMEAECRSPETVNEPSLKTLEKELIHGLVS